MLNKHYLYNAFLIESGDLKIAIDPGGKFLHYFSRKTLIPNVEKLGGQCRVMHYGDEVGL